jgi:hypothetical protein
MQLTSEARVLSDVVVVVVVVVGGRGWGENRNSKLS